MNCSLPYSEPLFKNFQQLYIENNLQNLRQSLSTSLLKQLMNSKMAVTTVNTFEVPVFNDLINCSRTLTTLAMLALIIVTCLKMTDKKMASVSNANSFVSSEMNDKRTN